MALAERARLRPVFVLVATQGCLCLAGAAETASSRRWTATGCPTTASLPEEQRIREFQRIHHQWPPSLTYPGGVPAKESEAWREAMKRKLADVMSIESTTWRWERWLELTQIQMLINFTTTGWGLGTMPADVHDKVQKLFRVEYKDGEGGSLETGFRSITGKPKILRVERAKLMVTEALWPLIANWSGFSRDDIEPTSTYGIRVYERGSMLETHVDRAETHVLSAVYVVDCDYDSDHPGGATEPWAMEYDPDFTGHAGRVEMRPGDIFFYESAKLSHGRPSPLHGNFSAHMFVHFRPRGWTFANVDRIYAVPPGWNSQKPRKEL